MKITHTHNRGATLIELITSIAILSIVGICCFTLLMFSIKTNNFILTGTSACRDAEVLNDRLAYLFKDAAVSFEKDDESGDCSFDLDNDENADLTWNFAKSTLYKGETVLQENITEFSAKIIDGGTLLRIEYIIDDTYTSIKIFPCASCSTDESSTE